MYKRIKSLTENKRRLVAVIFCVIIAACVCVFCVLRYGFDFGNEKANENQIVYGYFQITADDGENLYTLMKYDKDFEITYNALVINNAVKNDEELENVDNNEASDVTMTISRGKESCDSIYVILKAANSKEAVYESELVFNSEASDKTQVVLTGLESGLSYCLYVCVKTGEDVIYYVSEISDFVAAAQESTDENTRIVLLDNLSGWEDEVVVTSPQTWELNGFSLTMNAPLSFICDDAGKMCIYNTVDSFNCGEIACDTPQWDYEITCLFGNFNETQFYYINAASINGVSVDCTTLCFDNNEKLDKYLKNGVFDDTLLAAETDSLLFFGEYELTGFELNKSLDLIFEGNITVSEEILVSFLDECSWSIDSSDNATSLADSISFNVPRADVTWIGDDCAKYAYAEQYMNFATYNGEAISAYIGGAGSCTLKEGSLLSESGDWISLTVDGNYLSLTISYINNVDMDNTQLLAVWEGDEESEAEIIKDGDDYYCVATDSAGEQRGYKLILTNKEYNLPVIYITTDDGEDITSLTTYKSADFSLDYNATANYDNIESAEINIRGRGHSSWKLDKKSYKIKFEDKTSLFGLTAAKEWCLIANHADYSLIRNTLAMEMASELDNLVFVPTSSMVDVFVNGTYVGVYSICEQIEIKEGRLPGEKDSTEVDADYLLEMGGDEKTTVFGTNVFATTLNSWITINTPDEEILTKEQYNYISSYMQKLDEAIISGEGYEEYIDVPSLVDYFILLEFSYNVDGTFRRSNFMLKKSGDKLYMASPWDYDYAFGNMSLDTEPMMIG